MLETDERDAERHDGEDGDGREPTGIPYASMNGPAMAEPHDEPMAQRVPVHATASVKRMGDTRCITISFAVDESRRLAQASRQVDCANHPQARCEDEQARPQHSTTRQV